MPDSAESAAHSTAESTGDPTAGMTADMALGQLYTDVLGIGSADESESFFGLGGTSLHVVRLLERVHDHTGVAVELETFFRDPTLLGLRRAVAQQQADMVTPLLKAASAGPLDRPALVAPDGELSYAELTDLLNTAAKEHAPLAEPLAMPVESTVAGAREVLTALAEGRPVLVLDPASTATEQRAAWEMFTSEPLPQTSRAVHAVATSGSTGRPKVVVASNGGMLTVQHEHARMHGLGPEDTYLVMAPLHTCFGLTAGMLVGLLSGATVLLPPRPLQPETLRACVDRHQVTMTMGVSFTYRMLLASGAELHALDHAMVGGDPLPTDLETSWQQHTAAALMNSYGCTETSHISSNTDGINGSVGRPLSCVTLRVLLPDGTLGDTGEGELLVRSPGMAHGYAGQPEITAERFADGWYHTGDLAEIRADGHVFLHGRADDQINLAGSKVDPREVEQACTQALGLTECAVIGVTGATGVVEIRAYVVADHQVSQEELARAVADRLSPHKIPGRVVRLAALPRTASGKLRRGELP